MARYEIDIDDALGFQQGQNMLLERVVGATI